MGYGGGMHLRLTMVLLSIGLVGCGGKANDSIDAPPGTSGLDAGADTASELDTGLQPDQRVDMMDGGEDTGADWADSAAESEPDAEVDMAIEPDSAPRHDRPVDAIDGGQDGNAANVEDVGVDRIEQDSGVETAAGAVDAGMIIGPTCDPTATEQTITFVHVNDLHSNYVGSATGSTPYERIKGYEQQVRAGNPYTVFTNGGDDHEKGSVAEQLSQGLSTIEIARLMRFDVRVIGNHDFAWSEHEALLYSHDPHALTLASNIRFTGSDPTGWGAVDYAEAQIGCVRAGFFGLVSKAWDENDETIDDPYYPDFSVRHDHDVRTAELVAAHRKQVDLLVMVSHLGESEDEELAATVPGIDVILGAHSHTILSQPAVVGKTLIVQAGAYAQYAARLDLVMDLPQHQVKRYLYLLNAVRPELMPIDMATQTAIASIVAKWAPGAYETIAWVSGARDAPAIADIAARAAIQVLDVDASLVQEATVWTTWNSGPFTQQQALDTFEVERQRSGTPGFNSFYLVDIAGTQLRAIASSVSSGWRFRGPSAIDPAGTYKLALQKRTAYHPVNYLPAGVVFSPPVFGKEAWEVLDVYGRSRNQACMYIDADSSLPACP